VAPSTRRTQRVIHHLGPHEQLSRTTRHRLLGDHGGPAQHRERGPRSRLRGLLDGGSSTRIQRPLHSRQRPRRIDAPVGLHIEVTHYRQRCRVADAAIGREDRGRSGLEQRGGDRAPASSSLAAAEPQLASTARRGASPCRTISAGSTSPSARRSTRRCPRDTTCAATPSSTPATIDPYHRGPGKVS
jgi:hypothetical protein